MPFEVPTLAGRREETRAAIEARLPGADARLRHSPLTVVAEVMAGAVASEDMFLAWFREQPFADTAESDFLQRHADIWDVVRRPATAATGTVTVTGEVGAVVPAGAEMRRSDGALYRVDEATLIGGGGTADVTVTAILPGAAGNAAQGSEVTFLTSLAGVAGSSIVGAGGLAEGADQETDDALRARVLERIRKPPHGGNMDDYVRWALEVPGVTRAWVAYGELGRGTVTVRFMMDDTYDDGIPQGAAAPNYSGDVAAVFDHIEALRPVTARLYVVAPIPVALDVTVRGLAPDTPDTRAAAIAEIADAIVSEAVPSATFPRSKLWEAVSRAAGERSHEIVTPATDVTQPIGRIFVPGAVSFVA